MRVIGLENVSMVACKNTLVSLISLLIINVIFSDLHVLCEDDIAREKILVNGNNEEENKNNHNNVAETKTLMNSVDEPLYNNIELNIQDQCNQLWSLRNKLANEVSKLVKNHKEFSLFLINKEINNTELFFEEIYMLSLEMSLKNNTGENISSRMDEYLNLASEHMFISIDEESEKAKINVCEGYFHSSLREFFQVRKEYNKFIANLDLCSKKSKKTIKSGLIGINTLLFFVQSLGGSSNSVNQENVEYLKGTYKKYQTIDSGSYITDTLKKFQSICDTEIVDEDELSRRKRLKWLKRNLQSAIRSLNAIETLFNNVIMKNIKNLVNCITHFHGLSSINNTTSVLVYSIGSLIVDHYNNRKNILNVILFRYFSNILNNYILRNKFFSLWLFIQNRITSIQVLFSIVKDSNQLIQRVNSLVSMENLTDVISKCSEALRRTASNWDIFFSNENDSIINEIKGRALYEMNQYSLDFQNTKYIIDLDWGWLSLNIESILKRMENSFEKLHKNNIEKPLLNCSKNLSHVYKSLVSEFKPSKEISEKSENKIVNKHKNALNEALSSLLNQQKLITSIKNMFLWPHNNATIFSAISMYNKTAELLSSINTTNSQDQEYSFLNLSFPSNKLLLHHVVISDGFLSLYNNIKMRFDWDLKTFQNDFGYLKKVSCGIESENTIDSPVLKIAYKYPLKPGQWFLNSLEFSNIFEEKSTKVKKVIKSAITFRLQFIEQWSEIMYKLIVKIGNPIAYMINKHSEEAFTHYLQIQTNISREFSSIIEGNTSIFGFINEVDNSLNSLNMDSFISKFNTRNEPRVDESYRSEDEFSSVTEINNYLFDLRKRIDKFCIENGKNENKGDIEAICESISFVYATIEKNMKEVTPVIQKLFTDLDAQKIDIAKLDSIIQNCVSFDKKIDRVKCWVPNQFIELPLRRTIEIRKVMTENLREIIRVNVLDLSNYIESYININFDKSIIFKNNDERSVTQEVFGNIQDDDNKIKEQFSVLLKLTKDIMSHIMEELNSLESIYLNYYGNQVKELTNSSKDLLFSFVKLKSMKTSLVHYYGKPNIFQKIFKFPKVLLSKNEVYDIENSISGYETVVNNNVTYANDLCDYIERNMASAKNHTDILNKFLRTLYTTKSKLEGISSLLSNSTHLDSSGIKNQINLRKYDTIQQKTFYILNESDKFLKLGNIENFRYLTIRNMTLNVSDTMVKLTDEINLKEKELEKKEEAMASTNCFRRWRWKKRVKQRNKKKKSKKDVEKTIKINKSEGKSRKLQEIKRANKKFGNFLMKTIEFDDLGQPNDGNELEQGDNQYDKYSDRSDIVDLESFQFDDYYKFDNRPGYYNPKNRANEKVHYDLDTGGHTDTERKVNPVLVKIGSVIELGFKVNDFIKQYKEIKESLKEGAEFGSEESGVNLMAFFDVLNAISGGPGDDIEAMFGPASPKDDLFSDMSILGQLRLTDEPEETQTNFEATRKRLESIDISYEDFKKKVELELRDSDFDFDD